MTDLKLKQNEEQLRQDHTMMYQLLKQADIKSQTCMHLLALNLKGLVNRILRNIMDLKTFGCVVLCALKSIGKEQNFGKVEK